MRALLVSMGGEPSTPAYFMPDNGLASLAGCLLADGHEVQVLDLNCLETVDRIFPKQFRPEIRAVVEKKINRQPLTQQQMERYSRIEDEMTEYRHSVYYQMGEEVAEKARRMDAQLVGFKLWSGDGWKGSIKVAQAVRAKLGRKVFIVGGGSQVDFFGDALLATPGSDAFDALSVAEGEPTIRALAKYIEGKLDIESVPNLIFTATRKHTPVERVNSLGELPRPCYDNDLYPQKGRVKVATFEETRGCPYSCAFCAHPIKAGKTMRDYPPQRIVDDMIWLQKDHGFRGFKFGGSYTPTAYLKSICQIMVDQGTYIPFCSYGRISDAVDADFDLFYEAGCKVLFYGFESGSQLLLSKKIHKGYNALDSVKVLKAAKQAGIKVLASTIFPNPGETEETRKATLDVLFDINPDGVPLLFPLLLPFTGWFKKPEWYGFTLDDPEAYTQDLINFKIRLLLPFSFWKRFDYKIDGKPFEQFTKESEEFAKELINKEIPVHLSDDVVLFSHLAGDTPARFFDKFRINVVSGDVDGIGALIDQINNGPVSQPVRREKRELLSSAI